MLFRSYGVPLRIDNDPTLIEPGVSERTPKQFQMNHASVESELAAQLRQNVPATGAVPNPFYGLRGAFGETTLPGRIVLVGRLDGPDPATVRRMVEDALRVERFGLQGRAYFDIQSTTDAGYKQGDDWIRDAYSAFREVGFECELDDRPATFGAEDPVTDVVIYAGWYTTHANGPFVRQDFRFKPGAIAYHIHSASGASVRSKTLYWVGPLLAKGAAATMGNVFEPYLGLTPHVGEFYRRLLAGSVFLEAAYASVPVLSWQTTFVGDPLYRPFSLPIDDQIARLAAEKDPDLQWAYVRKVNMLLSVGEKAAAENLCRSQAEALRSPVLWERLGDFAQAERRGESALKAYQAALDRLPEGMAWVCVARKLARCYEVGSETSKAQVLRERVDAILKGPAGKM